MFYHTIQQFIIFYCLRHDVSCLFQEVALYANHRGQHLCKLTEELFDSDKSIRILDAGGGTGIAGKAASISDAFVNSLLPIGITISGNLLIKFHVEL